MDTHSTRSHSILTKCAGRILFGCFYFVACAIVPLAALWPANDSHPQTRAMFLAAQDGNVAAIDKILRGGLDVDCCDETGITPLMAAARAGKVGAVRKLLAAGRRQDQRLRGGVRDAADARRHLQPPRRYARADRARRGRKRCACGSSRGWRVGLGA
jgi:hypothetical protein